MSSEAIRQKLLQYALRTPGTKSVNFIFDNRAFFGDANCAWEAEKAARLLWSYVEPLKPEVLVHKGIGSSALVTLMARAAYDSGSPVHVLTVRDSRKSHGMRRLVEGPTVDRIRAGARAVFVDDIFNRGDTYAACMQALRLEGFAIDCKTAAVLIDFWNNSRQKRGDGIYVHSVLRRQELGLTRKDASRGIVKGIRWHRLHLNDDKGLPVKSWPRLHEGLLYVGSDRGSFHCLDADTGDQLWQHDSLRPQFKGNVCVPAFLDNSVFITSYDGTLRRFDAKTGQQQWARKLDLNLHSSPCIDEANGCIFVGTEWDKHGTNRHETWAGQGDVVCVDARSGAELWRTPTDGMIPCTPWYSPKYEAVFCGSNDFFTYEICAKTGAIVSRFPNKGAVKGRPIVLDGRLITLSVQGWLQCFDLDSRALLWERHIGERASHPYICVHHRMLFVANEGGTVYAITKDGRVVWVARLRGCVGWGLTIFGDAIAALTEQGHLVTLNPYTGEKLSSDKLQSIANLSDLRTMQPPVFDQLNSRAYIATNNHGILALEMDYAPVY